jgi:spermidine synthase
LVDTFKVKVPEGSSGRWKVERFTVSKEEQAFQELRCVFNPQRPRRVVPAGTYTRLTRDGSIVMSDTPDEIRDHLPAIRKASGRCLVAGLGLGMVALAMLRKPEVEKVTVLEVDPDVVRLVGPTLEDEFGDRVEVVLADVFEWKPPKGEVYDVAWFDVWDNISSDNLPAMANLARRYARRSRWKGFWQKDGCLGQRERVASKRGWY